MLEKPGMTMSARVTVMMANSHSRFNTILAYNRHQNLGGIYDTHTNVMQYPKTMQPTHAYWEQLTTSSGAPTAVRCIANNVGEKTAQQKVPERRDETDDMLSAETIFPDVAPIFARNFLVTDTHFLGPPLPGLGVPGPDGEIFDIGPGGLTQVPENVVAELPDGCRRAFDEARAEEAKWKATWSREDVDGARAQLRISYNT